MRDNLIAFIQGVQHRVAAHDGFRKLVQIGDIGQSGTLWFGYGYFDSAQVVWWPKGPTDKDARTMSVEDGVDAFLQAYDLSG